MYRYRSIILAATASAALMGMTATGAMAFQAMDWTWTKLVHEDVNIDIDIINLIEPEGLVEVEKLQASFGDVKSKAEVHDIYNNASGDETGTGVITVPVSGSGSFDLTYVDPGCAPAATCEGGSISSFQINDPSGIDLTLSAPAGSADENTNTIADIDYLIEGDLEVPLEDVQIFSVKDAVDLPKIDNAAVTVANNQVMFSDVGYYLDDAQISAGEINAIDGNCESVELQLECEPNGLAFLIGALGLFAIDDQGDGVNEHTDMAALTVIGAATGFIEPAYIKAEAKVWDILNARVDNAATAVANNASFTLETGLDDPEPHIMVADLTQLSIGDVRAKAKVWDITLDGYTGFGAAGCGGCGEDVIPIVSNSATAVANNLNIRVGPPVVDGQ